MVEDGEIYTGHAEGFFRFLFQDPLREQSDPSFSFYPFVIEFWFLFIYRFYSFLLLSPKKHHLMRGFTSDVFFFSVLLISLGSSLRHASHWQEVASGLWLSFLG